MKVYLWSNFHEFNIYHDLQEILAAWVAIGLYLPQEHQRVFPILLVPSSQSDDSFPGQLIFSPESISNPTSAFFSIWWFISWTAYLFTREYFQSY